MTDRGGLRDVRPAAIVKRWLQPRPGTDRMDAVRNREVIAVTEDWNAGGISVVRTLSGQHSRQQRAERRR